MRAFVKRDKDMSDQILKQIRDELAAGRYPGVSLLQLRELKGHVVVAYDVEETPDGFDVYVYDNNTPYAPGESTTRTRRPATKASFTSPEDAGRSREGSARRGQAAAHHSDDSVERRAQRLPTLASLGTAGVASIDFLMGQFASADGSATIGPIPAKLLVAASARSKRTGRTPTGTLVGPLSLTPLVHTVQGIKEGQYSELLVGDGFTGAVLGVPTGAGVEDQLSLAPGTTDAHVRWDCRPATNHNGCHQHVGEWAAAPPRCTRRPLTAEGSN